MDEDDDDARGRNYETSPSIALRAAQREATAAAAAAATSSSQSAVFLWEPQARRARVFVSAFSQSFTVASEQQPADARELDHFHAVLSKKVLLTPIKVSLLQLHAVIIVINSCARALFPSLSLSANGVILRRGEIMWTAEIGIRRRVKLP